MEIVGLKRQASMDDELSELLKTSVVMRFNGDDRPREALRSLLAHTPKLSDIEALTALHLLFPRETQKSGDPALLAIAETLVRHFAGTDRRPLTCTKAWMMLDPAIYEKWIAKRLQALTDQILSWQRTRTLFVELQAAEIDLIEYFFETLPPGEYTEILVPVMDLKVLSNRRLGLIRRMAYRVRNKLQTELGKDKDGVIAYLEGCIQLLDKVIKAGGYKPIIDLAQSTHEQLIQFHQKVAAPPPEEQGQQEFFKLGGAQSG
jgi:hypothetical protein